MPHPPPAKFTTLKIHPNLKFPNTKIPQFSRSLFCTLHYNIYSCALLNRPLHTITNLNNGHCTELLKVADVQTHVCATFLSICAKFVFLNAKQEKQTLFYDFGTIWQNSWRFHRFLWHFKPIVLRKIFSQKILPAQKN